LVDGKEIRIYPTNEWQNLKQNIALDKIKVNDLEFYITSAYIK
jgi:hypothetical protein